MLRSDKGGGGGVGVGGVRPIGALSKLPRKASGSLKWDGHSSIGDLTIGMETGSVVGLAGDTGKAVDPRFATAGRMALALSQAASVSTASASNLARQLLKSASNPAIHPTVNRQNTGDAGKDGDAEGGDNREPHSPLEISLGKVPEIKYGQIEEDESAMMTYDSKDYRHPVFRAMMGAIKNIIVLPKYSQAYVILLSGNSITDLSPFSICPRLRLLDVSFNKLQRLPDEEIWSRFKSLEYLYLNDNDLQPLSVLGLSAAPSVIALTLYNNPLALHQYYRQFAANLMQSCQLVDNNIVVDEELVENACFPEEYASCNPRTFFPNALLRMREFKAKDTDFERLLDGHKRAIGNLFVTLSPAFHIQRAVRTKLLQEFYASQRRKESLMERAKLDAKAAIIQAVVRTFLIYVYAERELKALLTSDKSKRQLMAPFMPKHMLNSVDHVMRIQHAARHWVARLRRAYRASRKITRCFREWSNLCRALNMLTVESRCKDDRGLFVPDEALPAVYDALVDAGAGKRVPASDPSNPDRWRKTDVHLQHFRVTPFYMVRKHGVVLRADETAVEFALDMDHRREADPREQRSRCLFHFEKTEVFPFAFRRSRRHEASAMSRWVCTLPLKSRGHYLSREERRVTRGCLQVDATRQKRLLKRTTIRLTWVKIRNGNELRHVARALRTAPERPNNGASGRKPPGTKLIPILCSFHIKASMAVLTLQSAWRACVARKRCEVRSNLRFDRALTLVQRWWRMHSGLKRRLAFIRCLNGYLRKINSNTLFIEAEVYYLLIQQRPDFIAKFEEKLGKDDFRFGFDDTGHIRPYGQAVGRTTSCLTNKFPQWIWVSRDRPKVAMIKTASVPYDPRAAATTPRMSPVPTPRRMTVSITSNTVDPDKVIISTIHHGSIVDAVSSPISDPDGKAEPVHIGSVREFDADRRVEGAIGGAVGGTAAPQLPRITLWDSSDEVRLGTQRRLIRMKFVDVVEARRRAAVLMRCTYDWRDETFVKIFSHAMLRPPDVPMLLLPRSGGRGAPEEALPSLWLSRFGAQFLDARDRVKLEVLCQMLTKEVLPFDPPPRPPSPEFPEPSPGSLSARQPRPSRPSDDVVQRPMSARDPSRHSKLLDTTKNQTRVSSAPAVEPTISAPPVKPPRETTATDDRDLDDLGKILRLKVSKHVEDGEKASKKVQAAYKAPSGGGATARLTMLQKYEVPQFVKACRRAEEDLVRDKEIEAKARKDYVAQLNKEREIRHRTIAESRNRYREQATVNMNQERAQNTQELYEGDKHRAMEILHVKERINRQKQKQKQAAAVRSTTANFLAASSMLSRHGSKSGGKDRTKRERAERRRKHDAVINNGLQAKARNEAKRDAEVSKTRKEIAGHRALMKQFESDRQKRWTAPPVEEDEVNLALMERQRSREARQATARVERGSLSVVNPSPDDKPRKDARAASPTPTAKSRRKIDSPSATASPMQPLSKGAGSPSAASPWPATPGAHQLDSNLIVDHIIGAPQGIAFGIEDAVSIAPSFGSHTADEPTIITPRGRLSPTKFVGKT